MKKSLFLAFIVVIILAGGFASDVLAVVKDYYGYVTLRDASDDKIWSDDRGQYIDNHISGGTECFIRLWIDSKGNLTKSEFKCGWPPSSTRRAYMDLLNPIPTQVALQGSTEEKFLNILLSRNYNSGDPIAHLQGGVSISGTTTKVLYVDFILDTITRQVLWGSPWNITDTELQKYRFSNYTGLPYEDQHLIYGLDYRSCTVSKVSGQTSWAIAFDSKPVGLFVYKRTGGTYKNSSLATFGGLPFGYNTWPYIPQSAPSKYSKIPTLWGGIKAK